MLSAYVGEFIVARSYAKASARQRRILLGRFVAEVGDKPPSAVDIDDVLRWWQALDGLSKASRAAHLSAASGFCGYLVAAGAMERDLTTVVKRPVVRRKPPVVLSDPEVHAVLGATRTEEDVLIVALMLGCGLRTAEVAALRVDDVDQDRQLVSVTGKGDKTRVVPVPDYTAVAVANVTGRRTHGLMLEVGDSNHERRVGWVSVRATAVLRVAGVKQQAYDHRSPHVLRRTFATRLAEAGVSLEVIQELLGHESIATTMAYIARPKAERLASVIELGPLAGVELPKAA